MRVTKLLAIVMIYLIISLTFSSALVFATIYKAEMYGQDQAPGVIRPTDNVVIRTESVMPCSVAGDFLNFTNFTYAQMSCGSGTPMSCSYTKQVKNVTGKLTATVNESASGLTQNVEAYVDSKPPIIISLSMISLGNMAKASYALKDEGNDYDPSKCSGFRKVELLINNKVVNSTNYTAGICSISDGLTGTIPNYVGKVNTSIKAYDYVGFTANQTGGGVFIDTMPPKIIPGAKAYKPGTDEEIKKISTNSTRTITGDILIIVEDEAIAASGGVIGDFSGLDKTNSTAQTNATASCTRPGWNQTHECLFTGIKISPSTASPKFMVTATDEMGNTASQNLTISFTVINNPGTVTRLGPDQSRCYQDTCYLKSGENELTALISTSSSYNNSEIKIEGEQATCYYNSTWTCKAQAKVSDSKINLEGYDDLGNRITTESTLNIVVDSSPPQKVGVLNATPECPTSKESLKIMLNVSEAQSPTVMMKARTSQISTNNETIAACTKIGTSTNWQCALTVNNILEQEINTNLQVIVEDFAGNQLVESVPVSICVLVDEVPELIEKIKTRGTLPSIDRKTASKITIKAPIGLEMVLKQENVEILSRTLVSCTGTPCLSGAAYMIDDISLKPTLIVPLKYATSCGELWDDDNKIEVNCTQEFSIKQANRIYTQRETEIISADLEVYNQPIGSVNETYEKKIIEIKKEIIRLDGQIAKYQKVYKILGTMCNLAEGLGKINSLLQAVKAVIYGVLTFIPIGGDGAWTAVQGFLGSFQAFVDSKIWPQGWVPMPPFPACSPGPPPACTVIPIPGNIPGLVIKMTCAIYTCKFYDYNTYVDIGMSYASYFVLRHDVQKLQEQAAINKLVDKAMEEQIKESLDKIKGEGESSIVGVDAEGNIIWETTYPDGTKVIEYPDGSKTVTLPGGVGIIEFNADGTRKPTQPQSIPTEQTQLQPATPTAGTQPPAQTGSATQPPSQPTIQGLNQLNQAFNPIIEPIKELYDGLKGWYNLLSTSSGMTPAQRRIQSGVDLRSGQVIASNSITGEASLLKTDPNLAKTLGFTSRVNDAVDAFLGEEGSWIFNPYKSKHYDKFCAPAIMFNDKKERQLLCKRLGCLDAMAKIGGPLEACEFDYNLDMCMYVESARYKIEGKVKVLDAIGRVLSNNLLGTGLIVAYLYFWPGCAHYHGEGGQINDAVLRVTGWRSVACGITGSLLSLREILAFAKNKFSLSSGKAPADLPKTSPDFCSGVKYQ